MPSIYVASLSDYNAGRLHGCWIDATQEPDEIWEEVQAMLKKSKEPVAEEWAIHDYDSFGGMNLGEYESFEKISLIAQDIELYGESEVAGFYDHFGTDYDGSFPDHYVGKFDSEKEFGENYAFDCMEIPEHLESYIDYESIASDLFMGDYWSAPAKPYGIHVYRSEV